MAGELPFIGRADELGALHSWLGEAIDAGPRAVLLRGEAGVGKTRLLDRFAADVVRNQPGVVVLRATCYPDAPVPYLPLATALRPIADLASLLRPLIDDTPEHADERRLHLYVGAADLVQRAAASRPLLLVIDDLHWADQATIDLLGHLLHVVGPMMSVLPHRPVSSGPIVELTERMRRAEWHRELDVFGLDRFSLHDLVEALTGERPARKLLDGLAEASGGNPLLVRSLLSRLEAFGVLALRDGRLTHRGREEILAGPAELDGLLRHRVRDLSRPCLEMLVVAAFLGEGGQLQDARAVMGTDETRFARLVDEAVDAGVLRDHETVRFDHPQVRYVMYQRPRGPRRQELHLKVADHLEALSNEDPARVVAIAHHLRRAGARADPDRVIRACLAAASHAAAVVAWGEAARAYDAAIEGAERSDEGPSAMRALLHARSAYAHWYNHDNPGAYEHASAAIELARPLGDLTIWAEALTSLAKSLWSGETGAWGSSFDFKPFDDFLDLAGEREPLLRARVHHVRGTLRFMSTDVDRARDDLDTALALATAVDDARTIGEVTFARASVHIADNELSEATEAYEKAYAFDSMVGNELHLVSGHRAIATVRWIVGDLDEAAAQAQVALEMGPPIAAWAECANAAAVAAGVAVAQGRLDDAEDFGTTAERLMRWAGHPPAAQLLYPALACARTLRGDFEGAHEALDAWAMVTSPGIKRFRSLVHAHEGNVDAVAVHRPRPPLDQPKSFSTASLAAAIEIGDLLDDIDRIAWAAPGITYLAERGVRFDLGWCSFLPRLTGVAALRLDRLDDAARWLDLAAVEATRAGAVIEARRVAADQERLLAAGQSTRL
ncbi:MAG: hypothetical protein QOC92_2198 [Acidimicrobiaceae bacterium]